MGGAWLVHGLDVAGGPKPVSGTDTGDTIGCTKGNGGGGSLTPNKFYGGRGVVWHGPTREVRRHSSAPTQSRGVG